MDPKSNGTILLRDRKGEDTERQRGKGHVRMEAGVRVMQPQAKEHQKPSEAGRGEEEFFHIAFKGSSALPKA